MARAVVGRSPIGFFARMRIKASQVPAPSRRQRRALGGLAVALPAVAAIRSRVQVRAAPSSVGDTLVARDGWVLKRRDI